ncbi:MAG: YggS family pyridoxal phosphate-dependent enzyme [Sphingomonadales bacterium]|nr:YggS family pyridoxal phosphate-dependent enzyme [Sphingomonadales bacterium]MDE2168786.1 YggS family pyridoxal phosphate-dependent enzyme [Sphingomonadales bacterium]
MKSALIHSPRRPAPPAAALEDVGARIATAARVARRKAGDVTLIAISKTHEAPQIMPLIAAGQRVFGENRVQEAAAKWPALREAYPDIQLHLVGQLQSNKAEEAVALFDAIHSVDRPSLVTALAKAMDKSGRCIPCFVQVNIGAEAQKGGCAIADLGALLAQVREADLPLAGLMCVPPADIEAAPFFALLAKLSADHGLAGTRAAGLSMGMSGDFETAVQLGATHVRVGSALFGARPAVAG